MGLSCSLKNMAQQNKGGLILIVGLKAPTAEFASFLFCFVFPLFWCQKIIASKSSLDPCTFTPLLSDSFDLSTYTLSLLLMCMKGGSCSAWGSSLPEKSEKIGNWSFLKPFSK